MSKILIVEDQPKLAALLRDYVQAAGYGATCIDNGLDVVAAVQVEEPALICWT